MKTSVCKQCGEEFISDDLNFEQTAKILRENPDVKFKFHESYDPEYCDKWCEKKGAKNNDRRHYQRKP